MTPSRTSRGRPNGSGLNDAAQLRAIAGLLANEPELKPTTAIKKLGIHDPSVIRRLRDKYHALEGVLTAELKASAVGARDALTSQVHVKAEAAEREAQMRQRMGGNPPE